MSKNTNRIKQITKQIKDIKDNIAKERDQLRDLINEAEALECDIDDACNALVDAADALSRLV